MNTTSEANNTLKNIHHVIVGTGLFLTSSLGGIGIVKDYPILGYTSISVGIIIFAFTIIFALRYTTALYNDVRSVWTFLTKLKHCKDFCTLKNNSKWPFGSEFTIIGGRDNILKEAEIMLDVSKITNTDEVLAVTRGLNISSGMMEKLINIAGEAKVKAIIDNDDVEKKWKAHFEALTRLDNFEYIKKDTGGIRIVLIKDKVGYICCSPSIKQNGKEEDYYALYTTYKPALKMIENCFNEMWGR